MANLSDLHRRLNFPYGVNPSWGGLPQIILMSDDKRLPDPTAAAETMPSGSAVILRHRDPHVRRQLAETLKRICRARSLCLIVAGDARLALAVGADGIHIAERDLARSGVQRRWAQQRGLIVTAAVHGATALRHVNKLGLTAALLSPVFATDSHVGARGLGVLAFTRLAAASDIPVYALGGVNRLNVCRLRHSGAAGIAGISGIADIIEP